MRSSYSGSAVRRRARSSCLVVSAAALCAAGVPKDAFDEAGNIRPLEPSRRRADKALLSTAYYGSSSNHAVLVVSLKLRTLQEACVSQHHDVLRRTRHFVEAEDEEHAALGTRRAGRGHCFRRADRSHRAAQRDTLDPRAFGALRHYGYVIKARDIDAIIRAPDLPAEFTEIVAAMKDKESMHETFQCYLESFVDMLECKN